jgi:hypothetical protein
MNENELLETAAEEYRKEGYTVHLHPSPNQLPDFLRDEGIDMVAEKESERIAIQVKSREQLYTITPMKEKVDAQPGWGYDIVVLPRELSEGQSLSALAASSAPGGLSGTL